MPPDLLNKLCAMTPLERKQSRCLCYQEWFFPRGLPALMILLPISSAPVRGTCKGLEAMQVNLVCLSPPAPGKTFRWHMRWPQGLQITGWRWLKSLPMASASPSRELCAVNSEYKASSTCKCQEVPDIWVIYVLIVHMNIKSQGAWRLRNKPGSVGACRPTCCQSQIPFNLNCRYLQIAYRTMASLSLVSSLDFNQVA